MYILLFFFFLVIQKYMVSINICLVLIKMPNIDLNNSRRPSLKGFYSVFFVVSERI